MKARTKKTRWLLIALLFGLLAAAGLTFTRHHGVRTITATNEVAAPKHTALPPAALVAANVGKQTPALPAGTASSDEAVVGTYYNDQQPHQTGHSDAQSDTSTGGGIELIGRVSGSSGGSNGGSQPQGNHPSSSDTGNAPQTGSVLAYNGYAPLDCELPAACGANGGTGYVARQPSGTSGGAPFTRDSQGGQTDDGSPPPDNNTNPQTNQTNDTGQGQDPPGGTDPPGGGSKSPVASAPELDPATLAGAVTLLLGSLAVLHRRRVRVTR